MKDALEEFFGIVERSGRLRFATSATFLFPLLFTLPGMWLANDFELRGAYSPMTAPIREFIVHRYLEGAMAVLGSGLVWVASVYRKERKRLAF